MVIQIAMVWFMLGLLVGSLIRRKIERDLVKSVVRLRDAQKRYMEVRKDDSVPFETKERLGRNVAEFSKDVDYELGKWGF